MSRPNILFIMSDEHDAGVTGCYGNDIVNTPYMDSLAEDGIRFANHYTTSPLCVPARLSFTAGKYISRCGAWSNNCWLPSADYPSIARQMSDTGYQTLMCGKNHYDATRRYGFTLLGKDRSQNSATKLGTGGRRAPDDESINTDSRDSRFSDFYTADSSRILNHDRQVTEDVAEFLSTRRRSDAPFFLFAGYVSPHFPLIVPEQYWRQYEGRVPMPEIPDGMIESQPTNYRQLQRGFGVSETDPEMVRYGRELYYGHTTWLDHQIGILLDTLDNSDIGEETIVIYTSDHGENKGDHHMWWKNCMYDHAAKIPMLIRWPQRWEGGQIRAECSSMVDTTQTLAELAGAETPGDWDGDSMVAWMDDPDTEWKDLAISEYYAHHIASGFSMLRSGHYKYVYHARMNDEYGPERELYDMQQDPGEFNNLADDSDYQQRIEQMHALLVDELGRDPDETEQICRHDYERGYGRS